jgi:halocyanin-like protein
MTRKQLIGRRTFLRSAGGIAVASLVAGCIGGSSSSESGPSSVDDWLSKTRNYNGAITDRTGTNAVTVKVGPKESEYVFAPPAIKISPGTTVTWDWIGGGRHNVVSTDGTFKSGSAEVRATFQYTFETAGTSYYYCAPHKSMGMKGAVVVTDTNSGDGGNNETGGNTSNSIENIRDR